MGISLRHTRRMLTAYREHGATALAQGLRGHKPVNTIPESTKSRVVHLAGTKYQGANHTHLNELLSEREGIHIGRTTLRRILADSGMASPRGRRLTKHRVRRERMAREGMLIRLDGSHHRWLGQGGPQFALLFAVDDTTGAVVNALFCEQEDSLSYFRSLQGLIQRRGLPLALHTDRHPVFKHRSEHQSAGTATQFGRTMEELGVQSIFALSPQAKRSVERAAETFQDRLITELRPAGAATLEEAKTVLKQFLPRFNRRLGVPPKCPKSALRPLDSGQRLGQIRCFKHRRRVARDNTVKFRRHTLQMLPGRHRPSYAGAVVVVPEGLDGRLSLHYEGRIIASQNALPGPGALRIGEGPSADAAAPSSDPKGPAELPQSVSEPLKSGMDEEKEYTPDIDGEEVAAMSVYARVRKPAILHRETWKAVQEAKRNGLSIRAMARELRIHRHTLRRYIDAHSPPTRHPPRPAADTIAE